MLKAYLTGLDQPSVDPVRTCDAVWVDLFEPKRDIELQVEQALGFSLPTREDMDEIETSSRLYLDEGVAFMTAQVAFHGGLEELQSGPVTFALKDNQLVTVRYVAPKSLDIFAENLLKKHTDTTHAATVFAEILDIIIDRTADLIEKTAAQVETLSKHIFTRKRAARLDDILMRLGQSQNDVALMRDSLVSFSRLLGFAAALEPHIIGLKGEGLKSWREQIKTLASDVSSLSDHISYVSGNIAFYLDAALGMINIEQNNIVRLISITSVIFLPLTLIASIYGMNFDIMPGLHHPWAFWTVCGLMLLLSVGLLGYFRFKRWF